MNTDLFETQSARSTSSAGSSVFKMVQRAFTSLPDGLNGKLLSDVVEAKAFPDLMLTILVRTIQQEQHFEVDTAISIVHGFLQQLWCNHLNRALDVISPIVQKFLDDFLVLYSSYSNHFRHAVLEVPRVPNDAFKEFVKEDDEVRYDILISSVMYMICYSFTHNFLGSKNIRTMPKNVLRENPNWDVQDGALRTLCFLRAILEVLRYKQEFFQHRSPPFLFQYKDCENDAVIDVQLKKRFTDVWLLRIQSYESGKSMYRTLVEYLTVKKGPLVDTKTGKFNSLWFTKNIHEFYRRNDHVLAQSDRTIYKKWIQKEIEKLSPNFLVSTADHVTSTWSGKSFDVSTHFIDTTILQSTAAEYDSWSDYSPYGPDSSLGKHWKKWFMKILNDHEKSKQWTQTVLHGITLLHMEGEPRFKKNLNIWMQTEVMKDLYQEVFVDMSSGRPKVRQDLFNHFCDEIKYVLDVALQDNIILNSEEQEWSFGQADVMEVVEQIAAASQPPTPRSAPPTPRSAPPGAMLTPSEALLRSTPPDGRVPSSTPESTTSSKDVRRTLEDMILIVNASALLPLGSHHTTPASSRHTTPASSRHTTPASSPYATPPGAMLTPTEALLRSTPPDGRVPPSTPESTTSSKDVRRTMEDMIHLVNTAALLPAGSRHTTPASSRHTTPASSRHTTPASSHHTTPTGVGSTRSSPYSSFDDTSSVASSGSHRVVDLTMKGVTAGPLDGVVEQPTLCIQRSANGEESTKVEERPPVFGPSHTNTNIVDAVRRNEPDQAYQFALLCKLGFVVITAWAAFHPIRINASTKGVNFQTSGFYMEYEYGNTTAANTTTQSKKRRYQPDFNNTKHSMKKSPPVEFSQSEFGKYFHPPPPTTKPYDPTFFAQNTTNAPPPPPRTTNAPPPPHTTHPPPPPPRTANATGLDEPFLRSPLPAQETFGTPKSQPPNPKTAPVQEVDQWVLHNIHRLYQQDKFLVGNRPLVCDRPGTQLTPHTYTNFVKNTITSILLLLKQEQQQQLMQLLTEPKSFHNSILFKLSRMMVDAHRGNKNLFGPFVANSIIHGDFPQFTYDPRTNTPQLAIAFHGAIFDPITGTMRIFDDSGLEVRLKPVVFDIPTDGVVDFFDAAGKKLTPTEVKTTPPLFGVFRKEMPAITPQSIENVQNIVQGANEEADKLQTLAIASQQGSRVETILSWLMVPIMMRVGLRAVF